MTKHINSFALITDPSFGSPGTAGSGGGSVLVFGDVALILAATGTLALMLLLWARYGRSRRERNRYNSAGAERAGGGGSRRRRRRSPLGRNPTRAETGGLPPIRADGPTPPSP